jgi:glycosyltransferase involved in cell wall biosynthesis
MHEPPLISVIIPAYNAQRWIGETLESIAGQQYENLEVVVVDDGSADATAAAADAYANRFGSWRLVRQQNSGQTTALNAGLALASGRYVQYLDADDILLPGKLAAQVRRLEEHPGCVASAAWGRFYDRPANARFDPDGTWKDLAPVDWLVENWADGAGMMFPAMWLVPMEIVRRVGPWREDLTLLNDTEYFSRVILASQGVRHCPDARVAYRSGLSGSLSGRKSGRALQSAFRVLEACDQMLLAAEDSDRTRRAVSALWQSYAHGTYPHDRAAANRALARARALHPAVLRPEGGPRFNAVARLIGWKGARILQRIAGRD